MPRLLQSNFINQFGVLPIKYTLSIPSFCHEMTITIFDTIDILCRTELVVQVLRGSERNMSVGHGVGGRNIWSQEFLFVERCISV
ncbi:hypothetical protein FKM82_007354 [Ascaphus truei]